MQKVVILTLIGIFLVGCYSKPTIRAKPTFAGRSKYEMSQARELEKLRMMERLKNQDALRVNTLNIQDQPENKPQLNTKKLFDFSPFGLHEKRFYAGLENIINNLTIEESVNVLTDATTIKQTSNMSAINAYFGVRYKYSSGIFIAPEGYYASYGMGKDEVQITNSLIGAKFRMKNEFGFRVNLGYDYEDQYSIYTIAGYGSNSLSIKDDLEKENAYTFMTPFFGYGGNIRFDSLVMTFKILSKSDTTLTHDMQDGSGDKYNYALNSKLMAVGLEYKF